MSAEDNLSPTQFEVYRGMQTPGAKIDRSQLGVHWTGTPEVAHDFAKGEGLGGYATHRSSYKGASSVIHATVTKSAIHPMDNEEDYEHYGISMDQDEDEIPLKQGAKVSVNSITTYRGNNKDKSRVRRYKSPRKMTT
jgi:hypothetical protein